MDQTGESSKQPLGADDAANAHPSSSKKRLRVDASTESKAARRKLRRAKAANRTKAVESSTVSEQTNPPENAFVQPGLWKSALALRRQWNRFSAQLVTSMICCAIYGLTAFGNTSSTFNVVQARASRAPYAIANAFMAQFCQDLVNQKWVLCSYCSAVEDHTLNLRIPHVVMMKPAYIRQLFEEAPLQLQMLSLIVARMEVQHHFKGFASGDLVPYSLLKSPIITTGQSSSLQRASSNLHRLFQTNLRSNPLFHYFQTILERPNPQHGLSVLDSSVVESIVKENVARGPLQPNEVDFMPQLFALLTDARPLASVQAPRRNTIFEIGTVNDLVRQRSDPVSLRVYARRYPACWPARISVRYADTRKCSISISVSIWVGCL